MWLMSYWPNIVAVYYIGLGSNLGDRHSNLVSALQALRRYVEVLAVSSLYETEPQRVEGPPFLNAVARVATGGTPAQVAADLARIEARLGRPERRSAAARPIDLDLLVLDQRLLEQPFYLAPVAELCPQDALTPGGQSLSELAAATRPAPLRRNRSFRFEADRQSGMPEIALSVDRVGVQRIKRRVQLLLDGRPAVLLASFRLDADLAHDRAGVHMSRFSERLEGVMLEAFARDLGSLDVASFLPALAREVMSSQHARSASVEMEAFFPLERWTPVSGRRGEETYLLQAGAFASAKRSRVWLGVEVEGMTACPCAQMMMREQGQRELLEAGFSADDAARALDALPAATHNQRGRGRFRIGLPRVLPAPILMEDLVEIVESSMSSETYELLKRPDEFFIVNKAHRNPRFVEDVVRGMIARGLDVYRDFPDDVCFEASQINDESIHKHDAIASAYGTLAEFRQEIASGTRLAGRTQLNAWLRKT